MVNKLVHVLRNQIYDLQQLTEVFSTLIKRAKSYNEFMGNFKNKKSSCFPSFVDNPGLPLTSSELHVNQLY